MGWKDMAIALAAALLVRALVSFAPDGAVSALFCRPPARAAALYYGAPFDAARPAFTARGVTMEVTRACAALDFFSIVCGALAASAARPARRRRAAAWAAVAAAYPVTLAANALRLVALVPVDAALPRDAVPAVHLGVGAAVFLSVFIVLWHFLFNISERSAAHETR